jgi:lipopolysaccharide transport system permease protein
MATTPLPASFAIRPIASQGTFNLRELWAFRELFYMLVWRNLKVRYKQTAIGVAWALIQPFALMFVFTVFFGYLTRMPSDGIPYPLFVYSGLVVWTFVSTAFGQGSQSVVMNQQLVTKIYFPRAILPASTIASGAVDLGFSFLALFALMAYYGVVPGLGLLLMPVVLLIAVLTTLGLSLWFSALYVLYRDVGHLIPFVTQLWMFSSPIIYPVSLVPEALRPVYALNPMVTIIEGTRWAFAGSHPPSAMLVVVSLATSIALVVSGYYYFRRHEATFSDIV